MKSLITLLILFFCLTCYSLNNNDWDELIESAHDIGYCLYNVNKKFCNQHIEEYNRLVKETEDVEPEVHHFVMREEWAKNRVTTWAERVTGWEDRTNLDAKNLVLFFSIPQDLVGDIPIATVETASSFFVVNLEDDLKFSVDKSYKKIAMNCSISHKGKPNMLYNIFWREFMSGRLGLVKNEVEFTVSSGSKVKKKFRVFRRRFKRLMRVV
ncbi:hypothetical protein [Winogradskyella sp.]|uniref:hypothetical protein n=1 Tax=Winogradskyella sp. TaxID=1883156 RepID=UPI001B2925F1|nr:hypothetical protein [Winogradskyella sp.]MBO6881429.1 hypothetical protein [Winogradskyella sp.]